MGFGTVQRGVCLRSPRFANISFGGINESLDEYLEELGIKNMSRYLTQLFFSPENKCTTK